MIHQPSQVLISAIYSLKRKKSLNSAWANGYLRAKVMKIIGKLHHFRLLFFKKHKNSTVWRHTTDIKIDYSVERAENQLLTVNSVNPSCSSALYLFLISNSYPGTPAFSPAPSVRRNEGFPKAPYPADYQLPDSSKPCAFLRKHPLRQVPERACLLCHWWRASVSDRRGSDVRFVDKKSIFLFIRLVIVCKIKKLSAKRAQ